MRRASYALAAVLFAAACVGVVAHAQQPAQQPSPPPFATTKVDGTDNVYIFRYGNHQSMFVVTSAGVIATDPIGYGRPQAVVTYVDEIKKVSGQPIKYLIYSHHHFDHIAGGKPFKDAGATIVAHKRAAERLAVLKDPHTVLPDETMDGSRTITLGDTTLELTFLQDASAAVKAEAQAGKCWDPVEKDLKLPKYENWAGYAQNLPFVLRRYCALWGRGT